MPIRGKFCHVKYMIRVYPFNLSFRDPHSLMNNGHLERSKSLIALPDLQHFKIEPKIFALPLIKICLGLNN